MMKVFSKRSVVPGWFCGAVLMQNKHSKATMRMKIVEKKAARNYKLLTGIKKNNNMYTKGFQRTVSLHGHCKTQVTPSESVLFTCMYYIKIKSF